MEIFKRTFSLKSSAGKQVSRRRFMITGFFGAGVIAGSAVMSGCNDDNDNTNNDGVNLGSGDKGILNYAYALEQLESAFYTRVLSSPYSGMSATEMTYLQDIRDGEISHREFFKTALGADAIPTLELDFSSVNFASRESVLNTASTFENTGVSAYNGAGRLLTDPANLLTAGKIVSVEARYAAILRDLIQNNSFASSDLVDLNGLDKARVPLDVLALVDPFIVTRIDASNLPS